MNFFKRIPMKMDVFDVGLIKLSVAVAILFIITIWPAAMNLVHSINAWWFLVAFVVFVARPFYRIYLK
jgi:hypothetical protein